MSILVISNMYPDEKNPSYGIFVKRFCEQLDEIEVTYDISVMKRRSGKVGKILNYINFYLGTMKKLLFNKYDLIYIHYASHSCIPVLLLKAYIKTPIYTNVHGSDVVPENNRQKKFQKYTRQILELSDKIIVPSEYFKKYVIDKYALNSEKICIYPSAGIDQKVFYPFSTEKKNELRKKYGFHDSSYVFGYIGRITSGKGWDVFLRAVAEYKSQGKQGQFLFVGSGNEEEVFEQELKRLGLQDSISHIGLLPQSDLVNMYNMLDVLIFPTKREGESLGLVALEAMACGIPVLASDFAAPKYYVMDGENGYKFELNDYTQLAELMMKIEAKNNDDKKKMSEGALKTAKNFYADEIKEQLMAVFE